MRTVVICAYLIASSGLVAQAQETRFQAELRSEQEQVRTECSSLKSIPGCAMTLATDHPLHIAFGAIAPQNGFGVGAALVTHYAPNERWRINWSSDAVVAPGGAWRAGTYLTSVRTAVTLPQVVPSGTRPASPVTIREYPVFDLYGQVISLPTLTFFGLGPDSSRIDKTSYGMTEAVMGGGAILPLGGRAMRALHLSVLLDANVRLIDIRSAPNRSQSIEARFSELTAPGLSSQPVFVQFGEGVRLRPSLGNDHVRLSYTARLQQFVAPSTSSDSFRRWSVELDHQIPLYYTPLPSGSRDTNGPNECAMGPTEHKCPPVARDRWGAASFRVVVSKSLVGDGRAVPFYLQHTLGGSDVNGDRGLASYDDYRFRGPHVILLQQTLEHSIYGPVGLWLGAEEGKVVRQGDRLNVAHLRHSFGAGITLRAGGFPAATVSWATGGAEGRHITFTIDAALLGGSARPSLY